MTEQKGTDWYTAPKSGNLTRAYPVWGRAAVGRAHNDLHFWAIVVGDEGRKEYQGQHVSPDEAKEACDKAWSQANEARRSEHLSMIADSMDGEVVTKLPTVETRILLCLRLDVESDLIIPVHPHALRQAQDTLALDVRLREVEEKLHTLEAQVSALYQQENIPC